MAQNYTRQSTLSDGDTITASLFNDEYNQLVNAFTYSSTSASSTGHRHDGSAGQGGNIFKIGDLDFLNKIEVDSTNNRWGFYVEVSSAAVEQIRIQDGAVVPVTTNDIDLGTSSLQFKDLYIDGTANVDSLTLTSGATVTTILDEDDLSSDSATALVTQQSVKAYVDSQVTAQDLDFQADTGGALSIDLDSETLTFTGGTGIDTSGSGNAVTFAIDSTVTTLTGTQTLTNKTLTSPDVNTPDIDGGTIDGTVIGGTTAAAGSFTTVSATGNITVGGTVDGRDVATDGTKLDGIESGATADQTAAEIRTLVDSATDSNVFTDADHTKLDGIEAGADVTDTTNVTAAGAVMDSELTNETAVKSLNQGVATTDSPTFAGLTTTANVSFGDNDKAIFGAGSDLQIYHNGTGSYIEENGTGNLFIEATNLRIKSASGENYIAADQDGAVTAYYDNTARLATTSTGIDVTGVITTDGMTTSDDINFGDNDKAVFGAGSDLQIYHDSNNSYIKDAGTGYLILGGQDTGVAVQNGSGQNLILTGANAVTLSYGSASKLATTSTGIDVTGTVTADGLTVSPSGTQQVLATLRANSGAGGGLVVQTDASDDGLIRGYDSSGNVQLQFDTDGGDNYIAQGNVGIGTSSPSNSAKLDAAGAIIATDSSLSTFNADNTGFDYVTSTKQGRFFATSTNTTGGIMTFTTGQNGSYAERMRIDSSGNVGIGTSSPTSVSNYNSISVDGTNGSLIDSYYGGTLGGRIQAYSSKYLISAQGASLPLALGTNNTERMRIDSSGQVGINTTSNQFGEKLSVNGFTANVSGSVVGLTGANSDGSIFGSYSNHPALFRTNNTERMRIDSSGQVGIGTASPARDLHIESSNPRFRIADSDGGYAEISGNGGHVSIQADAGNTQTGSRIDFEVDGSQKARIDVSGNLMVGKTNNTLSNDGTVIRAGGEILVTNTSDIVANFNRTGTDGSIVTLYKDGTTVGSIGVAGGSVYIDGGASNYSLMLGSDFRPRTSNGAANNDATVDLGDSQARFKDLYLSNQLNVTGSTTFAGYFSTSYDYVAKFESTDSAAFIVLEDNASTADGNRIGVTGDIMEFETAGSEAMRIDSSGNLLVGKTSADTATVGAAVFNYGMGAFTRASSHALDLNRTTSDGAIINFRKDNTVVGSIATNSSRFELDGSGNPVRMKAGTSNIQVNNNTHISFDTAGGEAARFDTSGNLLVGKTSSALSTGGVELAQGGTAGKVWMTRDGANVLYLNRLTSDGDIATFYKDGTTVGSIGNIEDLLYIATDDTTDCGIRFDGDNQEISPCTATGAYSDGNIDLGDASGRFKDLYLSGGVYVGGTGSANKLDDYEEGTWTPVLEGNAGQSGQTYSGQTGTYTKIGRQVTCRFKLTLTAEGTFTNTYILLAGLPFTLASSPGTVHMGNMYFTDMGTNFISVGLQGYEGNSKAYLWAKKSATASREYVGINDLSDTTTLTGTFTYFV